MKRESLKHILTHTSSARDTNVLYFADWFNTVTYRRGRKTQHIIATLKIHSGVFVVFNNINSNFTQ